MNYLKRWRDEKDIDMLVGWEITYRKDEIIMLEPCW
jgi:hypothetical protein